MPLRTAAEYIGKLLDKLASREVGPGKALLLIIGAFLLFFGYPLAIKVYDNERDITEMKTDLNNQWKYKFDSLLKVTAFKLDSTQKAEADRKANFSLIRENEVRKIIEDTRIKIEADRAYIIELHNSGGTLNAYAEKHFSIRFEQPEGLPEEQQLRTFFTNKLLTTGLRNTLEKVMVNGTITIRNVRTFEPFVQDKNIMKYLLYFGTKSMVGVLVGRDQQNLSVFFLAAAWRGDTLTANQGTLKEFQMIPAANEIRKRFDLAPIDPYELQRGRQDTSGS